MNNPQRCWSSPLSAAALLLLLAGTAYTQALPPTFKPGVLPQRWPHGSQRCVGLPEFYVHRYNEDLYVLRQSGCSNYEKPFLYLLFGREKALLLDTGAGNVNVARAVRGVVDRWLAGRGLKTIPLVVAHTHAHGDHRAGDEQLRKLPNVTLIGTEQAAVQSFFGVKRWPEEVVQYDLGGRVLDVIPIPGHEASSIAVYDRQTAILLTGDTLYPGRLYVETPAEFVRSIQRLVDFTRDKPVAHILGTHIENRRAPYLDYEVETKYQPDEHTLELGRAHLLELNEALTAMNGRIVKTVMRDFTIWPLGGR
jgi:hydroxyacylglutathione hydrolase